MKRKHWLNSIAVLCNFFYGKRFHAENEQPEMWMIPLVGIITGGICALFSGICFFLMGAAGCGIISAIVLPLFLELLSGWKGVTILVSRLEALLNRWNPAGDAETKLTKGTQSQILLASVYLFRMALFGLLASRCNGVWFLYAIGGGFLIRGEFLTRDEEEPGTQKYKNWIILTIGFLAAALLSFRMTAIAAFPLALLFTWLLSLAARKYFWNSYRRSELDGMELCGTLAENLLLLAGLIFGGGYIHG